MNYIHTPGPSRYQAFWSYARANDRAEHGRITDLASLLADQIAVRSTQPFEVFVDRRDLGWGDLVTSDIDAALRRATYFVPILTPGYFESRYCRAELSTFLGLMEGCRRFLLPIHYATVADLDHRVRSSDPLVEQVKAHQYADWRDVADEDRVSGAHRKAVRALAERLIELEATVGAGGPPDAFGPLRGLGREQIVPGRLGFRSIGDELASLQASTRRLAVLCDEVGDGVEDEGPWGSSGGGGPSSFASQVASAKAMRAAIEAPSGETLELATALVVRLRAVDGAISQWPSTGDPGEGSLPLLDDQVEEIERLADTLAETATRLTDGMAWSTDLRATAERLSTAVAHLREGGAILGGWRDLIRGPIDG